MIVTYMDFGFILYPKWALQAFTLPMNNNYISTNCVRLICSIKIQRTLTTIVHYNFFSLIQTQDKPVI